MHVDLGVRLHLLELFTDQVLTQILDAVLLLPQRSLVSHQLRIGSSTWLQVLHETALAIGIGFGLVGLAGQNLIRELLVVGPLRLVFVLGEVSIAVLWVLLDLLHKSGKHIVLSLRNIL